MSNRTSYAVALTVLSFILLLLVIPGHSTSAQQREIFADRAPSFLFADPEAGRVHLFTAGIDANFDGVFQPDSGDAAPRWLVIDAATEQVVDSLTFTGFFNSFPIRAGVDAVRHLVYLPQYGRVRAFDYRTMAMVRDTVIAGNFAAVSCDSSTGRLMLAERIGFSDPGYVWVYDPATGDTLARVRGGVNPGMAVAQNDGHVQTYSAIAEGGFGTPNAAITRVAMGRDIYRDSRDSLMSGGASWIEVQNGRAYIALGGGHALHVIDVATNRDLPFSPVRFGAVRQNGPRCLGFRGDSVVLVGTYNGEMIFVSAVDGTILDTTLMRGKVEGIAVRDSLAFVAIRGNTMTSSPDSVLQVVNLNTRSIVGTIPVGSEPLALWFAANGDLQVVAVGDPSGLHLWRTLDATTLAVKRTRTFAGRINNPFRAAYEPATDSLYAIVSDTLCAASAAADPLVFTSLFAPSHGSGLLIGVAGGSPYLLAQEAITTGTGPEYVHVIDHQGHAVARMRTSPRPFLAAQIPSGRPGIYRFYQLNRGVPSAIKSPLDVFEISSSIVTADTLGSTANHIVLADEVGLVTLTGSHQVAAVDLFTGTVLARVALGTTGFNGPREAVLLEDGRTVVSTYNGDVRVIGRHGEVVTYPIHGKGEGITAVKGKVFVADAFNPDYSADSFVTVFDTTLLVATVERVERTSAQLEQNVPNPAADATTIAFSVERAGHVLLTLHSLRGDQVATMVDGDFEAGSYRATVNVASLPSGTYLYRLSGNGATATRTLEVVR